MKKLLPIIIISICFNNLFAIEKTSPDSQVIERRMAIDVGSGSTKVTIADVDAVDQKILSIVFEESFPVPYQASLESSYSGSFEQSILDLGMKTFYHIAATAENYEVEKVTAVATAAFRDASNGERFTQQIQMETGIPLKIIPQREEGTIAFFSGIAESDKNPDQLIVLDIGTGSFQMTTMNESDDLSVFMGNIGSIPFRNYIIDLIQGKNSNEINTPNPMTEEDVKAADRYARSLGRKAFPIIKDKIREPEIKLVGIGRLFSSSIGPIGENQVINRKHLRSYINEAIGLSDVEIDNPYAHVDVSNSILVLAFMKALHIHEIHIIDTKSTRGMLIYTPYWK